ncbi:hypothetical protein RJ641_018723 [Dillenia turbinata]|uniref:Uncharacterized protein n=1 Tax=Dillenia turbinata TaxID=194707 RepID=A0AAN8USF6_9MAGN
MNSFAKTVVAAQRAYYFASAKIEDLSGCPSKADAVEAKQCHFSCVNMKVAQVRRTQLKPSNATLVAISFNGFLSRPSATIACMCAAQYSHANLTRFPNAASMIHLSLVERGSE